jgi:4-carboxymuconolactone decarboxylase
MLRLPPIPPSAMSADRRALHDEMADAIGTHLHGFVSSRPDGALVGPFSPMLNFPAWGGPAWEFTKSLMDHTTLPKAPHEVAILVTGAAAGARYELYAHERVAAATDLSKGKIATIVAGQRPSDLTVEEAAAYDMAAALSRGGALPEATYQCALDAFGRDGTAELIYLIGCYSLVSVLLNAFDVDVPGADETTDR